MPNVPRSSQKARAYTSPVRREQAHQTRRRILTAAQELFLDRGYPATSLAQVATAAGVSADTVYKVFGSKIGLLKELLDTAIGGDDQPVGVLDRPGPQALRTEPDPRRQIHLFAQGVADQLARIRPIDDILRSAAAVDAEAAALRRDIQDRQRLLAMRTITEWITGPVAEGGRAAEERTDAVWALTSPEVHELLVTRRGWSQARFAAWLEVMLTAALLP